MAARKAATSRASSLKPLKPTPIEDEILTGGLGSEAIEEVTIGDLTIKMRKATEDQFMIILKHARLAEKTQTKEAVLRMNEIFFQVIEDLIIDPMDLERLDDGLTKRTVTVRQISAAMQSEGRDGSTTPPARTRRGR